MKSEKWIVCRVCLNQPKEVMQTIFSEEQGKDLTRMILECGGVPIKQFDHYPDKICSKCFKQLQMSYKFRITCQRSYKHLSRFIAPVEVDQPILEEVITHTRVSAANIRDNEHVKAEQEMHVEDDTLDQEHDIRQIDLTDLADESADGEHLTLKLEPENDDDLRNFGQVDDVYYEDVYETYDGIEEVQDPERAPSEMSAEIEFLDEFEEINNGNETSDEEFIPNLPSKAPKRKRTTVKVASVPNVNTRQQGAKTTTNLPKTVVSSAVKGQRGPKQTNKMKKETISSYICDVCGNIYHSQGRLTEHIKLHSGIKPHECEICGHRFAQTQQLARHMNTHTGNRPYKCSYCTAAFADLSTRNKHHRIHTNERPYSCDVCGKTFTYTNTLKFHKMIHTGEKPHVCDICGKGFQQANKLRLHKRVHEKRGITSSSVKVEIELDDATLLQNLDVATGVPLMEM